MNKISATFTDAHPRTCLMPYFTLGYPNPPLSLDIIEAIANAGADLLELGIPFSDPLADGPSIQHSTQVALEHHVTVAECLRMVTELHARGIDTPMLLMSYMNPILAFGIDRFVSQSQAAGADGFIIPDLPLEEAAELEAACEAQGCALVQMLAPTSTEARITQAAAHSQGFLYLVSLTGTTGARDSLSQNLETFIQRVRKRTSLPLAIGFGISTPEQVQSVSPWVDGVIVGSAIIDAARQATDPARATANLVASLRKAVDAA